MLFREQKRPLQSQAEINAKSQDECHEEKEKNHAGYSP